MGQSQRSYSSCKDCTIFGCVMWRLIVHFVNIYSYIQLLGESVRDDDVAVHLCDDAG